MSWIKIILIAIGIYLAVMLGLSVIGIVYSGLWYLFWIGVLALGGVAGYKLLKKSEPKQIEGKQPIGVSELENADRALEEYKRKYLSEK
ncbi:MAG: hypothetical protein ABI686_10020 [Acidobacteriota bacterium]